MAKTALVVDDSVSIRQIVAYTLSQAGFRVLEGANGEEALQALGDQRVDLVVTDLNMPIMDGLGLTRKIRGQAANQGTPILLLTTEGQERKKQEGKVAGATGWIVKPIDPRQLLQVVAKVVS